MGKAPKSMNAFITGLIEWGGWKKRVCAAPDALAEDVSKTIAGIGAYQQKQPPKIGKLTSAEWGPIAETLPHFLNAYLQQELFRILEGSGDLITALRLVDDRLSGQLLMATVIVAREHFVDVEVVYPNPYGSLGHPCVCRLACQSASAILTIEIGREHGEEHLPLMLHYQGEDQVWDKEESTPGNPVWVGVPVNRKAAVLTDGLECGDKTKAQWIRDEFLQKQGFQPLCFSPAEIQKDPFACAAKAVALVTGKDFTGGDD